MSSPLLPPRHLWKSILPSNCIPSPPTHPRIQFEDFNIEHAAPLLDRYRYSHVSAFAATGPASELLTRQQVADDVQGTAAAASRLPYPASSRPHPFRSLPVCLPCCSVCSTMTCRAPLPLRWAACTARWRWPASPPQVRGSELFRVI